MTAPLGLSFCARPSAAPGTARWETIASSPCPGGCTPWLYGREPPPATAGAGERRTSSLPRALHSRGGAAVHGPELTPLAMYGRPSGAPRTDSPPTAPTHPSLHQAFLFGPSTNGLTWTSA